jgi:hypothetical protein
MENEGDYEKIEKEAKLMASQLDIPLEYIDKSNNIERSILKEKHNRNLSSLSLSKNEIRYILKQVIDRATFLEGVYNKAKLLNLDLEYINKQVDPKHWDADIVEWTDIPELGNFDKKAMDKIIKTAQRMQEKDEKRLESRLNIIAIGICSSFLGLSFLSSNLTGNVINNASTSTQNIIGIVLFVMGLVTTFFCVKNK